VNLQTVLGITDLTDVRLNEIKSSIQEMRAKVYDTANLVADLKSLVKSAVQSSETDENIIYSNNRGTRFEKINDPFRTVNSEVEKVKQNEELAAKVEKLLTVKNNDKVEEAKEKVKEMIEKNFVRMLAAILVAGPTRTHQKSEDVFTLMKSVLNKELDFAPVVEKMPFILRETETDQFIAVLKTLREVKFMNSICIFFENETFVNVSKNPGGHRIMLL